MLNNKLNVLMLLPELKLYCAVVNLCPQSNEHNLLGLVVCVASFRIVVIHHHRLKHESTSYFSSHLVLDATKLF